MKIFESTLRDGEQAAFIHLTPAQKASIAASLEALGVDVIDAGFPIASQRDWEGARAIADATEEVELSVLARHCPKDIDAAWEAVRDHIARARLATWVMPYELYSRHQNDPQIHRRIIESSRKAVRHGRSLFPIVQYYMVYSGNRDRNFLIDLAREVAYAGADCVAIADSQSTMNPEQIASLTRDIRVALPAEVELSVHCHNNMGLALSNSVAAINAGADQVEVTVGGMGDAGGNASLEQVLGYADYFEKQNPQFANQCRLDRLYEIAAELSQLTGFQYGSNQPFVGPDAYAVDTGIHHSLTRNIQGSTFDPSRIGRQQNFVVGRNSGVAGIG
jgi:2-isopropylmalate synthase